MTRWMIGCVLAIGIAVAAVAQIAYDSWDVLPERFGSTGGNGVVIDGYKVRVEGALCTTPFTATDGAGTVFHNIAEFDAVPVAGGILCQNGRWRAVNGSGSGTTPLQVFLKVGVQRGRF